MLGAGSLMTVMLLMVVPVRSGLASLPTAGGYFLFAAGFVYLLWHAFRHSAVIVTKDLLYVYPHSVKWSDTQALLQTKSGIRIQRSKARKELWDPAIIDISRLMYRITPEDVDLMESFLNRAA
jgi:hypothetical protein